MMHRLAIAFLFAIGAVGCANENVSMTSPSPLNTLFDFAAMTAKRSGGDQRDGPRYFSH